MKDLIEQAEAGTPGYYKERLPLPWVISELYAEATEVRGDRLAYVCPFHEDTDPSLHVWQEPSGEWRFKCSPCGTGGDSVDFVGKFLDLPFGQAVERAAELLAALPPSWEPPVAGRERPPLDVAAVVASQTAPATALWEFCAAKGLTVDPDELRLEWEIGCRSDEIVIPYYDRSRNLVAFKHRTAETVALAAPGSSLKGVLYGEWRDLDPARPVLLCEGESDAWEASGLPAFAGHAVLALPGAGTLPTPSVTEPLRGRSVTLAFDGDQAGRDATARWSAALSPLASELRVLPLPEGRDLRSLLPEELDAALRSFRVPKPAPPGICDETDLGYYARPGKDVNTPLSNWRLQPTRELVSDTGETAYEGILQPAGRSVTITPADLSSKARICSWSSRHGFAWLGSDRDAQALLALLQHQGTFLPSGRLTSTAGLHGSGFVWPTGSVGVNGAVVYSPPTYDVHLESRLFLPEGPYTALQITTLRSLHRRDVMDPILGWLAAAPLRALLPSFPTLAVTGSSGSGKTTLLSTVLRRFSGADIATNLTSTTKHALASFMACTNAFPVWFDEYRPGARKDTQMALEQLLRDAYTMQISAKGGLGEHWSEISAMQTHAPVVVSGEDTFTETSHTERMVNLPLPSQGKNPGVLGDVLAWGDTGLPRAYLAYLAGRLAREDIYLTPSPTGGEHLPTRARDNLGTIAWGWALLDEFCHGALGAPDLSLVESAAGEASLHNPIKDALSWALDEGLPTSGFICEDPESGVVYVRVESFVAYVERSGIFQLPGRAAAVKRFIVDQFSAKATRRAFSSSARVACLAFRRSMLD